MEELRRKLQSVGIQTFVLFFPILERKNDISVNDIRQLFSEYEWNDDSWSTKLSATKWIFKNNLTKEALEYIAASGKPCSYLAKFYLETFDHFTIKI